MMECGGCLASGSSLHAPRGSGRAGLLFLATGRGRKRRTQACEAECLGAQKSLLVSYRTLVWWREKRCSSRSRVTTRDLYDRTSSKTHFIHRIIDVRARESSATKQKAETLRPRKNALPVSGSVETEICAPLGCALASWRWPSAFARCRMSEARAKPRTIRARWSAGRAARRTARTKSGVLPIVTVTGRWICRTHNSAFAL